MYTRGHRFCAIVLYSHIDLNALADGARTTIDTSSRFDGAESNSAGVLVTSICIIASNFNHQMLFSWDFFGAEVAAQIKKFTNFTTLNSMYFCNVYMKKFSPYNDNLIEDHPI